MTEKKENDTMTDKSSCFVRKQFSHYVIRWSFFKLYSWPKFADVEQTNIDNILGGTT